MNQRMILILSCCVLMVLAPRITTGQDAGDWGHLTGQIIVEGDVPQNPPEDVAGSPDREICLVDGEVPKDDGIVLGKNNELRDVYVMMFVGRRAKNKPDAYHPSYEKKKTVKLTLDNKKCRFVPKALFARSGQTLILKNSDSVGHNCHITTFKQGHNVNITANSEVELKLDDESDKIPGEVKCDIHKWMDSIILIRDNPYVSITDKDGKFKIENLPAGDWEFQFWHKKAGYLKTIQIKDYSVNKRGVIGASIKKGQTLDLGKLTLPAKALSK